MARSRLADVTGRLLRERGVTEARWRGRRLCCGSLGRCRGGGWPSRRWGWARTPGSLLPSPCRLWRTATSQGCQYIRFRHRPPRSSRSNFGDVKTWVLGEQPAHGGPHPCLVAGPQALEERRGSSCVTPGRCGARNGTSVSFWTQWPQQPELVSACGQDLADCMRPIFA